MRKITIRRAGEDVITVGKETTLPTTFITQVEAKKIDPVPTENRITPLEEYVLYIDLRPGQTCHSKVIHRKEVTHSDGSYGKKSRRRAWLTIWDKVKSHGTVIDWCTGREWPVNCTSYFRLMTIKHAIPKILSGRLNYYITRWRQEVSEFWRPNQLVIRYSRESQQSAPPGLRLSSPGERERHTAMSGGAGEVNMLQSLFSLQLPLTHETFQIKWEVYFFKEVFARLYLCVVMILHVYA